MRTSPLGPRVYPAYSVGMRKKLGRRSKAAQARRRQWRALLKNDGLVKDIRRLQKQYHLPVTQGEWIDQTDDIANRRITKNKPLETAFHERMQLYKDIDALRAKHEIDDEWRKDLWGYIVLINPLPTIHPSDTTLPAVRVDFEKNRYEAVISPSVDMDDPKVIADIKHIQQKAREFYGMDKCPKPIRDMSNPRQKDWTPVLRHRLLTGKTYEQIGDELGYNKVYVERKLRAIEKEL